MSAFLTFQPYTLRRATLHNEGFCVGFAHQTLHTNPSDYQTLSPNCVGFGGNACTLEKRIGVKGEYARLARGSFLYFSAVFLFPCKVAQILLPLRPLEVSALRKML